MRWDGETILFAIGIAAVAVGLVAASRRVNPWWLFGGACAATVPIVVLEGIVTARSCDVSRADILPAWFVIGCVVGSLLLYGAGAVAGVADGIRQASGGGRRGPAVARAVALPLLSAGGVLFVLFLFLLAALHCD